jgi:hypothetical protein
VAEFRSFARLRGSAESKYILGGVVGNYEKALENSAAARLSTNGRASPRSVANLIVDSAYSGVRDCTGVTDADGSHGPGKGYPPCPFSTVFKQVPGRVDPEHAFVDLPAHLSTSFDWLPLHKSAL